SSSSSSSSVEGIAVYISKEKTVGFIANAVDDAMIKKNGYQ
ncbi:6908_t:CDS:2, partial [Racocetra fulgida]